MWSSFRLVNITVCDPYTQALLHGTDEFAEFFDVSTTLVAARMGHKDATLFRDSGK